MNREMILKFLNRSAKILRKEIKESKTNGIVVGLSGGVDSALALAICLYAKIPTHGIFIDIDNSDLDRQSVETLTQKFEFNFSSVDLTDVFNLMRSKGIFTNDVAINNLKPRLRMSYLYSYAKENNLLVAGTSNADEYYLGYFTKHGDGACDFAILKNLIKSEIYELGEFLELPKIILNRAPSASLYEGQTDEAELGLSYHIIDMFLLDKRVSKFSVKKIKDMHKNAKHKTGKTPSLPGINIVKLDK